MHKFLLLFILGIYIPSFGQQISIPYRDGAKWGISDRDGKLIIEPKFDSISFGNKYMNRPGHLIAWSGGKQGLITAGRELLAPEYDFVVSADEYIKAEKTTPGSILTYLFDTNGTPIYPGGIINIDLLTDEQFYDKQGSFRVLLLQVTGANNLESIFIWNLRDKAVLQWLAKDVYSAVLEDVKSQDYVMMRIREKEDSPVKISRVWFGQDGRLSAANVKRAIPVDKKRDSESEVWPYERGLDGDLSIEAPVGDLYKGVEPSGSYAGSGNGTVTGSDGGNGGRDRATSDPAKLVSTYKNYKKQPDGTLGMEQRDGSGKTWKTKIKFKPDSFLVKNFNGSSKRVGDTMYYYSTYAIYTYKGRSGVLKDGQTGRGTEYDELTDINYSAQKSYKKETAFIAGNRDKKSKAVKYGVINMEGNEIVPFVYDELTVANTSSSPGYDLLAKRNGKYEVITVEGATLVSGIDEVIPKKQESKPVLELRKGTLYGLCVRLNGDQLYVLDPIFPYPVKAMHMNYPSLNSWSTSQARVKNKGVFIVELEDANGNAKGFAREDGFLYFKN